MKTYRDESHDQRDRGTLHLNLTAIAVLILIIVCIVFVWQRI